MVAPNLYGNLLANIVAGASPLLLVVEHAYRLIPAAAALDTVMA